MYFSIGVLALLTTANAFEVIYPASPDAAKKHNVKNMVIDMYKPLELTWDVVKDDLACPNLCIDLVTYGNNCLQAAHIASDIRAVAEGHSCRDNHPKARNMTLDMTYIVSSKRLMPYGCPKETQNVFDTKFNWEFWFSRCDGRSPGAPSPNLGRSTEFKLRWA